MAEIGQRGHVRVATLGKVKTTLQIIAIVVLLYQHDLEGLRLFHVGETLLVAAAVLTIWSAIVYVRAAWPIFASSADVVLPAKAGIHFDLGSKAKMGPGFRRDGGAAISRLHRLTPAAQSVICAVPRGNSSVGRARPCQGRGVASSSLVSRSTSGSSSRTSVAPTSG